MKRKILSLFLVMTMGTLLHVGCSGNDKVNKNNEVNKNIEADKNVASDNVEESEEASSEMTETAFFEVNSISDTKVKVYYDPNVIVSADINWEPEFSVTDMEGNVYSFVVGDFNTAEDYFMWRVEEFNSIQSKTNAEFSGLEDYGIVGENAIMQYTLEYDQISTDDDNNPVYTPVSYSECIIELDSVVVCFDNTEEQNFWDVLATIKFVVGDENDIESNQNDNKEDGVEGNLQTYEFPAAVYLDGNETGILTYNGDFAQFTGGDEHFSFFDLTIKDEGSYTFNVTLNCQSNSNAETYYLDRKDELGEYDVSDLKETIINDIPVKYFTYVKKTDGDSNKFLEGMIDFPGSGYESRVVKFDMFLMLEEPVMLAGLENFLVDIEIEGVKPGVTTEDTTVGNEWPVFLPERPDAFEVLEVTVDQENNATHYTIDVGVVDYQTVKDYVDEIKNAGCDLGNGHEKYSEEGGYIAFEGVLDNHIITVYYDVEWNIFEIIIGE